MGANCNIHFLYAALFTFAAWLQLNGNHLFDNGRTCIKKKQKNKAYLAVTDFIIVEREKAHHIDNQTHW